MLSTCRRFTGSYAEARSIGENEGLFVSRMFVQGPDVEVNSVVRDFTKLYTETASGISRIISEPDSMKEGADRLPPVMPKELAALQNSEFCATVRQDHERMLVRLSTVDIDIIQQEHHELAAAYTEEGQLRSALKS